MQRTDRLWILRTWICSPLLLHRLPFARSVPFLTINDVIWATKDCKRKTSTKQNKMVSLSQNSIRCAVPTFCPSSARPTERVLQDVRATDVFQHPAFIWFRWNGGPVIHSSAFRHCIILLSWFTTLAQACTQFVPCSRISWDTQNPKWALRRLSQSLQEKTDIKMKLSP
jgi:hypothetical protein